MPKLLGTGSEITGAESMSARRSRISLSIPMPMGQQFSVGGLVDTDTKVDIDATASIVQSFGATITGDVVNVLAQQGNVDVNGYGDQSKGLGVAPVHDGDIVVDLDLISQVIVQKDAVIAGGAIDVKAKGATGNVVNDKNNDAVGIPVDNADVSMFIDTDAIVDIAGRLLPGTRSAFLLIDARGKVVVNRSFDGPNLTAGTTISSADATINGLLPSQVSSLTITAERSQLNVNSNESTIALGASDTDERNQQGQHVTFGPTASYQVPDRFTSVTIDNRSGKHLDINGIDVILPTTSVTPVVSPTATLNDAGVAKLAGVEVLIDASHATLSSNVYLDGAINNPGGVTTIRSTSGSIIDRNSAPASQIVTSRLMLHAGGEIGATGSPVQADASQETGVDPASCVACPGAGSVNLILASTTPAQSLRVQVSRLPPAILRLISATSRSA
ncbi:MAG: hypothetical protein R3C05_19155 [Pirellulaceae bacterium]